MMTESNNLLYHPNDSGFDRLEEMGGGALTRYPVLRSVPVPTPRPWSTRGAIALLIVCGVVFGVIAIATLKGSQSTSEATTAEASAGANNEGVSIIGGSGSVEPGAVASGSSWLDGSTSDSSADDSPLISSGDTSGNSTTGSLQVEESAVGSDDSTFASSFEEALANPLENWIGDSQLGSFESSTSDALSASADSMDKALVSGSDSTDASVDNWLAESMSGSQDVSSDGSASSVDWQSSFSMSDEASDSLSRSEDRSLDF